MTLLSTPRCVLTEVRGSGRSPQAVARDYGCSIAMARVALLDLEHESVKTVMPSTKRKALRPWQKNRMDRPWMHKHPVSVAYFGQWEPDDY